jgi:hypothetical protein
MDNKLQRRPDSVRMMPLPDGTDVILEGGRGDPPLLIRDHGDQEQRRRDRRRAEAEERTRAMLDQIEHDQFIRQHTPTPLLVPTDPLERLHREWERDDWFADVEKARARPSLGELEAWASKTLADEAVRQALQPPEPPPPTRYGKPLSTAALAHEAALERAFTAKTAALACRCGQYHAGDRCIYGAS